MAITMRRAVATIAVTAGVMTADITAAAVAATGAADHLQSPPPAGFLPYQAPSGGACLS
ncbi:hypothetical protein [Massilia sp. LC238]|uniref:hypothetical protein n=1 Tax=Massilia sp. LC238 TaxID=1502852 RepID=UPI001378A829|nr:hypothetical protein [Massilia sp. LC238]